MTAVSDDNVTLTAVSGEIINKAVNIKYLTYYPLTSHLRIGLVILKEFK